MLKHAFEAVWSGCWSHTMCHLALQLLVSAPADAELGSDSETIPARPPPTALCPAQQNTVLLVSSPMWLKAENLAGRGMDCHLLHLIAGLFCLSDVYLQKQPCRRCKGCKRGLDWFAVHALSSLRMRGACVPGVSALARQ